MITVKPIESLEEFCKRAVSFDFWYAMSDDHAIYLSGLAHENAIEDFIAQNPVAKQIWKLMTQGVYGK